MDIYSVIPLFEFFHTRLSKLLFLALKFFESIVSTTKTPGGSVVEN